MPRYKEMVTDQGLLIPVTLAHQLAPGTFEHALNYIVDHKLDMSVFDRRYSNESEGASAYNPRAMLKIVLFAYSRGITSSRDMEAACRENVVFMALAGENKPRFTTIALFIRSMEQEIRPMFRDVLLYCDELGLIGKEMFAIDGCKISSNASKEWSGTREDFLKKKAKYEEGVASLMERHRAEDEADDGNSGPKSGGQGEGGSRRKREDRAMEHLKEKISKIDEWLKEFTEDRKGSSGKAIKSNITDPQSAKLVSSHGVVQGYNGVAVVDGKHQVIVAAEAFGSGSEIPLLAPMVEKTGEALKELGEKDGLSGKILAADSGYHSEENLKILDGAKVDAYIADKDMRRRDPVFATADRHRDNVYAYQNRKKKYFRPADFVFDESGTLKCPAGKEMWVKDKEVTTKNGFTGTCYSGHLEDCLGCNLRAKCSRSLKAGPRQVYKFRGREGQETYTKVMKDKMDSAEGRTIYSERMRIVEPVFGNVRYAKGLDRFTLRGRIKVNIQWLLWGMVHNIEKILTAGWPRGRPPAWVAG